MKTEELEKIKNEMKRIGLSDEVIEQYPVIMVSDFIENKSYPADNDHKIKGAADGLEFLTETKVLHVVRKESELGKVLSYVLFKENDSNIYNYYLENAINCDFAELKNIAFI